MKKLASSDFSGGRVSNTWATYLVDWDNSGKPGLIPNNPFCFMAKMLKGGFGCHYEMGPRRIS